MRSRPARAKRSGLPPQPARFPTGFDLFLESKGDPEGFINWLISAGEIAEAETLADYLERSKALDQLVAQAQELGMGYE